jgi:hypothetical protein
MVSQGFHHQERLVGMEPLSFHEDLSMAGWRRPEMYDRIGAA